MKIVELRLLLPLELTQYDSAGMYMVARRAVEESDGKGEGIEFIKTEPYETPEESGLFSHKIYHYRSRFPRWIRWALPTSCTDFHEKSWTAFPHGKCVYFIAALGSRFDLGIDSWYWPYSHEDGIPENPGHLNAEELMIRQIVYVDIISSLPKPDRPDWNLAGYECPAAGIAKLPVPTRPYDPNKLPEWTEGYPGKMMLCVKVIKGNISIWGLQGRLEKFLCLEVLPSILLASARGIVGWAHEWSKMTRAEIEAYSATCNDQVNEGIHAAPPPPDDRDETPAGDGQE
jgi:hypothetical protein